MSDRDFWKFFSGLVGALFGVTIVLFLIANSIGAKPVKPEPGMDAAAIAERIKPVGEVTIASSQDVMNAVVSPANAADMGKSVYDKACVACHGTGVAGAPKLGDKAAWAPRIAQGMDALYATSIKGKGAMPPKGAYSGPDADVKAAVDYMVSKAK
jgi:cytochrome c5